jgi:hypothetical protein
VDWGTFVRREWGAVLFVVTVAIGLVAVPVALVVNGQKPAGAVAVATAPPASAPRTASGATIATPSPTPTK